MPTPLFISLLNLDIKQGKKGINFFYIYVFFIYFLIYCQNKIVLVTTKSLCARTYIIYIDFLSIEKNLYMPLSINQCP